MRCCVVGRKLTPWRSWPIWIRDRELAENFALDPFHLNRVLVSFVIVTDQMQETVHGKMGDMMGERFSFAAGLARDGFKGKNDVAEMLGRGIFRRE